MYLSRKQSQAFLGNQEKNAQGQTLEEFLEAYDPKIYDNPCNTVDTLVFTYSEANGEKKIDKLLLIRRGNHPCIGFWAIPGGFVDYRENLKAAALRELQEETGLTDIQAVTLKTYGDYDRDPRTRIITTAFAALVREEDLSFAAGDDASDAALFTMSLTKQEDGNLRLVLTNPKVSESVGAVISVTTENPFGIEEKTYHIVSRENLSADHGAIIAESYELVSAALKNQGKK